MRKTERIMKSKQIVFAVIIIQILYRAQTRVLQKTGSAKIINSRSVNLMKILGVGRMQKL